MRASPKFLNLFKIYLPITGLVSILHRISGVLNAFLFVGFVYLYYLLPQGNEIDSILALQVFNLLLWAAVSAFLYHFVAGLRHMFMDFSHQHSLKFARLSSWVTLGISVAMSIWVGVVIWMA
jgi:succinate dehydrogenase / fumarate reductase cytochrome b subunit